MTLRQNPTAAIIIGAFIISFSAVLVVLSGVPSTTSAFYRVFIGFLVLAAVRFTAGRKKPQQNIKSLLPGTALCAFAYALDLFFWHICIAHIGPGLATILGNFEVFFLAACGFFLFGEKLRLRFLAAVPLAFIGLFLLIGFHWNTLTAGYKTGVIFGLLTAVAYAAFLLLLRRIRLTSEKNDSLTPMMLVNFFSAIYLGIFAALQGYSFAIPTLQGALSLIALGVFSQSIGWVLITSSLPKLAASFTGLILLLQPTLSFIWDVLFFKRPTDTVQWVGAAIAIIAIYMGLTGAGKRKKNN